MRLSPVGPSKLPPELAQPVTKGSAVSTEITKTIRDITYNPICIRPGQSRNEQAHVAAAQYCTAHGTHQCCKLIAKYLSRNEAKWL
jgi:hypothetical protein